MRWYLQILNVQCCCAEAWNIVRCPVQKDLLAARLRACYLRHHAKCTGEADTAPLNRHARASSKAEHATTRASSSSAITN